MMLLYMRYHECVVRLPVAFTYGIPAVYAFYSYTVKMVFKMKHITKHIIACPGCTHFLTHVDTTWLIVPFCDSLGSVNVFSRCS